MSCTSTAQAGRHTSKTWAATWPETNRTGRRGGRSSLPRTSRSACHESLCDTSKDSQRFGSSAEHCEAEVVMQSLNIFSVDKREGRLDVARALGSSALMMFVYDLYPGRTRRSAQADEPQRRAGEDADVLKLARTRRLRLSGQRQGRRLVGQRAGRTDLQTRNRRPMVRRRGGLATSLLTWMLE